ncbi:probable WRKY transcription factor 31 isoform X1 [Brachypodium distachyon]|uniref:probable WRKY transcription factor 31 isoform X1 n=1 Tax=Brachypodium distachyon TaxID=15368 RepID=UPI0001D432D1|nr:probable WRKY transcription factor 31 isoform X1 [Brachypodium distachyon]|eukprot:XP_014753937.1 probable WRKY transcription factor 31 isoform X1 [Brachypodium distachyon]
MSGASRRRHPSGYFQFDLASLFAPHAQQRPPPGSSTSPTPWTPFFAAEDYLLPQAGAPTAPTLELDGDAFAGEYGFDDVPPDQEGVVVKREHQPAAAAELGDAGMMMPGGGTAGCGLSVLPATTSSGAGAGGNEEEETAAGNFDKQEQGVEGSAREGKGDDDGDQEKKGKNGNNNGKGKKKGGAAEKDKRPRQARFAFMTKSEVDHLEDGYRWRKYGQKAVKNSPFPRSYYRCTAQKCPVKKRVERSFQDAAVVITTYEGKHTHPIPATLRGNQHHLHLLAQHPHLHNNNNPNYLLRMPAPPAAAAAFFPPGPGASFLQQHAATLQAMQQQQQQHGLRGLLPAANMAGGVTITSSAAATTTASMAVGSGSSSASAPAPPLRMEHLMDYDGLLQDMLLPSSTFIQHNDDTTGNINNRR